MCLGVAGGLTCRVPLPSACLPLSKPENGGYTCHPAPCRMFAHGAVIEFFCNDGFVLSGDYNYLTCQDGQWDGPMQISCVSQGQSLSWSLHLFLWGKRMGTEINMQYNE